MEFTFTIMDKQRALQIAQWTYPSPYSMYSMDGTEESVREFLEESYYFALNEQGELVGYICYGRSARVPGGYTIGIYDNHTYVDIGLGMRPDFTGKGLGYQFFNAGLSFLENLLQTNRFRLVVATFNNRAIKVYERVGFVRGKTFYSKVNGEDVEFVSMTCSREE